MPRSVHRHRLAAAEAARQRGVVSLRQLVETCGWTRNEVRTELSAMRWRRIFDGVYAVTTGDLAVESLWWAAYLRCGEASALSGETALQAWRIVPARQPIEMAVPLTASARTPGVVVHRTSRPLETRRPRGLPPAVVPQLALLMVSNRLAPAAVMDLASSACQRGIVSADQLERAMRGLRLKHRDLIREIVAEVRGGATTPLEIAGVRRVLRAHGLPVGEGQFRERTDGGIVIRDRLVLGLILEFDGRKGHSDPTGRFRDLRRDNAAMLTGRPTLRFGWTDVYEHPCEAADQVARVLSMLGHDLTPIPCGAKCRCRLAVSWAN